ncbi:hypothetical protein [Rhodococcus sp. UNC23MFCrub1.1]|uniref:hypothetical protein n=1 Tax=Rhodococcus sp. UNC23MFCrub1.1 TaxID=1449068 RepID=UPI00048164AE|nr:hypothetical protein [Rhodococcus sp. UNC23MFCrub1.1]
MRSSRPLAAAAVLVAIACVLVAGVLVTRSPAPRLDPSPVVVSVEPEPTPEVIAPTPDVPPASPAPAVQAPPIVDFSDDDADDADDGDDGADDVDDVDGGDDDE